MSEFSNQIWSLSQDLSTKYNLDVGWFFLIYLLSFLPFYLGYFLIAYGTTRNLKFQDLLHLRFIKKFRWHSQANWGLVIHLFGRVMPYAYILIFGRNLSPWVYILVIGVIISSISYLVYRISSGRGANLGKGQGFSVLKHSVIQEHAEVERLWEIYNHTFEKINELSPCKQSFDREHFIEALHDATVHKYILHSDVDGSIGIALVTNDFKNTPWISSDYFRVRFPEAFRVKRIYYFQGLAIHEKFRSRNHSLMLIEHIIDDIPHDAIMGFDHSHNVNPLLHHFTKIVRQTRSIERTHIDKQHYHVVQRK